MLSIINLVSSANVTRIEATGAVYLHLEESPQITFERFPFLQGDESARIPAVLSDDNSYFSNAFSVGERSVGA
ncbi:hypothetical protein CLAFUW4_10441 [Fulvia fulva]|uniref:Uncharacterized protein n=1 Tax=Passalora fulva TaxID=5499 RepID=A0A9Q8P7Z3_PASFU|nr:uncharacterized protein CLAFUR5_05056 [Fulvia fulva]KAK4615666.1 hypothetical protein CLAFUR4_10445 [Fulvia fulva]KAK4616672.1 hypothetical protein CLAFUR0_10446 [Fulvia fulva]UJO16561.1 hypothetical protein CLAFUR5_05056 [Fulvia fulva]WPV19019.1 hypothetical protein CLAFUW4_10441 [Fulvia fulva]WPV34131.1 hypothetical protein CLAFUW7_10441 [Fulvia fulva]